MKDDRTNLELGQTIVDEGEAIISDVRHLIDDTHISSHEQFKLLCQAMEEAHAILADARQQMQGIKYE